MAINPEHPLHIRRKGRNIGVGLLLAGFVALVFGLTVVKVLELGDLGKFEAFDHAVQPQILPDNEVTKTPLPENATPSETRPAGDPLTPAVPGEGGTSEGSN